MGTWLFVIGLFLAISSISNDSLAAQPDGVNVLGAYADEGASITSLDVPAGGIFTCYFLVTNPINPDNNGESRVVTTIGYIGFYAGSSENLESLPPHPSTGLLMTVDSHGLRVASYQSEPSPLTNDVHHWVGQVDYLVLDDEPGFIRVYPFPPDLNVIYWDAHDDDGDPAVDTQPQSGSWDIPGLLVNDGEVEVTKSSLDLIKALYR